MRLKLLAFLLIFVTGSISHAGLLIEPYVGMGMGEYSSETKDGGMSIGSPMNSKFNGAMFGGRLGYKIMTFWTALDYTSATWTIEYDKPKNTPNATASAQFLFLDVGVDLPFLFRFYGGYGFSNNVKGKGKDDNGVVGEETFSGGSAIKAGIGFKFLHFLSVNLEYIKPSFSKYKLDVEGTNFVDDSLDKNFKSVDMSVTMLSVSFPLSLF